ncbi:hypothetical protein EAF04_010573 [Stromatinia cepivora]|nr:hypothetical protein EAF04_010573 [Stromatinia cepivora]
MAGSTSGPELWEVSDDSSDSDHDYEHEEQVGRDCDDNDEGDDTIEDEDEDEDTLAFPPEDIKTDLGKLLDDAETTGEIFSHGPFPNAPNPGISIKDSAQDDIDKIISASKQESIGTNAEAYPANQENWTLPAHKIEIQNPAWITALKGILLKVRDDLGIESKQVTATLIALVLSESESTMKCCRVYIEAFRSIGHPVAIRTRRGND